MREMVDITFNDVENISYLGVYNKYLGFFLYVGVICKKKKKTSDIENLKDQCSFIS